MDKDELKDVLLKSIHNEAVRLADELSDVCIQMLESRKPKEFEEDFAEAIKRFGAGLMGKSLESIEPQVITIMKGEPHAMRDEDGNSMPIECSGALRGKGKKDVTWSSTLGGVSVWRQTTCCKACGRWFAYLDEFMEITPQGMTPSLASGVAIAGTCEPYASSSGIIEECLHQQIDENRIRATVLEVAKRAQGWVTLSGQDLDRAIELLPTHVPVTVYMGVDGGRIRLIDEGWKEPCEGVIWWTQPDTGQRVRIAVGDVNDKEAVVAALDRWVEGAQRRNPHMTLIIVADGAEWIWAWAKKHRNAIKILDYYHLKEHAWETANALHGKGHPKAKKWVSDIMDDLWEGRVVQVVDELNRMEYVGTAKEVEAKKEAVRKLSVYLNNHEGLIAYAHYRAAHWDIGSGTVESTCKQLFNMRLKGPGMRWSRPGAQAVIHLRCLHITGRWSELWRPKRRLRRVA